MYKKAHSAHKWWEMMIIDTSKKNINRIRFKKIYKSMIIFKMYTKDIWYKQKHIYEVFCEWQERKYKFTIILWMAMKEKINLQ